MKTPTVRYLWNSSQHSVLFFLLKRYFLRQNQSKVRGKSICVTLNFVFDLSYEMQSLGFSEAEVQTLLAIGATGVATFFLLGFGLGFAYFLGQYLISCLFFIQTHTCKYIYVYAHISFPLAYNKRIHWKGNKFLQVTLTLKQICAQ